jgi:outer membrane protein
MKLMKWSVVGSLTTTIALAAGSAAANGGFVGAGVSAAPDYEGGDDYEAMPALFGRYNLGDEGRYLALVGSGDAARGGRLVFNVMANSPWELGPALGFRRARNDPDNNKVKRMDDTDNAFEAGGFVSYRSGHWFGTLGLMADVSNEYNGYIADLEGGYTHKLNSDLTLTYTASMSYADEEYHDHYFGVNGKDAASSGLPLYEADDGDIKDVGLGIGANYQFNKTWGIVGKVNYYRMVGDAEDSPIVDDEGDENQFKTAVAVTYRF